MKLVDILMDASGGARRRFGLIFPVLVSRPGAQLELLESATVFPIMTMQGQPPARIDPLEDEIGRLRIGRTSESEIALDDDTVSRKHAILVRHRGDRWSLVDEGGTNGTFVDGQRVEPGKPLEITGGLTTLRFGARSRLTFMYEDSFREFVASFEAERNRARTPRPIKLPPVLEPIAPVHVLAPPPQRQAAKTTVFMRLPAEEYLVARILDRVRSAQPGAKRFRVALVNAAGTPPEEVGAWPDLVTTVELNAGNIQTIEAIADGQAPVVVYQRPPKQD